MRNIVVVLSLGAATLALSACGSSRSFAGGGPDEMAVTRQAPLIVPPDFALVPPAPGTPNATSTPEANRETLEALFPPAKRSSSESSTLSLAGRNGSDIGVRSQAGDLQTPVVDKGGTVRDIIAAPEGDGQDARAVIPG